MSNIEIEKGPSYERDRENEDCERLLAEHKEPSLDLPPLRQAARHWSGLAIATAFLGTAILSAFLGAWIAQRERLNSDAFCIRHTSQYCTVDGATCQERLANTSQLRSSRMSGLPTTRSSSTDPCWYQTRIDWMLDLK